MGFGSGQGSQFGQDIRVHFRRHLGADKFAHHLSGQIGDTGFVVVLSVKLEGAAAIHSHRIGRTGYGQRTGDKAVVAVVVAEALHVHIRNQYSTRPNKFASHGVVREETGLSGLNQRLVQFSSKFRLEF